ARRSINVLPIGRKYVDRKLNSPQFVRKPEPRARRFALNSMIAASRLWDRHSFLSQMTTMLSVVRQIAVSGAIEVVRRGFGEDPRSALRVVGPLTHDGDPP